MPSVSKKQQNLFKLAYLVKRKKIKKEDLNKDLAEKISKITSGMSLKQIKDFTRLKRKKRKKKKIKENVINYKNIIKFFLKEISKNR